MNPNDVAEKLSEDGLQIMVVPTSHGASSVCANLISKHMAQATGAHLAQRMLEIDSMMPVPDEEDEIANLAFASDEGYSERKPMSANAKAARKSKKKMQKASRRANR